MNTRKCTVALSVALIGMSALAQLPYSPPKAWHQIDIDGQTIQVADYDGMAVIEGDIMLGPIDEVLNGNHRAIFLRNLWPDGIVGYTISQTMPSGNVTNIMSAIEHIEAMTSIVFEERTSGDRINFTPSSIVSVPISLDPMTTVRSCIISGIRLAAPVSRRSSDRQVSRWAASST